jgi:hypothetical protein
LRWYFFLTLRFCFVSAKPTWPGLRDHLVAGQISGGLGPTETMVKECGEEAGIAEALAATATPAGAVSYRGVDEVCDAAKALGIKSTCVRRGYPPPPLPPVDCARRYSLSL